MTDKEEFIAKLYEQSYKLGDCIIWLGPTSNGYGRTHYNGEPVSVHKILYELQHDVALVGEHITFTCGVGICMNLNHLKAYRRSSNEQIKALQEYCRARIAEQHEQESTAAARLARKRGRKSADPVLPEVPETDE